MRSILQMLLVAAIMAVTGPALADGIRVVPEGNRYQEQPGVPGASVRRTKAGRTSFDAKYEKVHNLLANDGKLMSKIKSTARAYGIDPIHMIGAIVGEHTYNVDAYDRLQSYYVKAAAYAGDSFRFGYEGETVAQFVARPEFSKCQSKKSSYALWSCRESVWDNQFRGNRVGGTAYPNNRFSAVFFQPSLLARLLALARSTADGPDADRHGVACLRF